jgi:transcriptional regulator with PAS, ATPase and Fis domain
MKTSTYVKNLSDYEREEIILDGVRLSDQIELIPIQGRKKNIQLNRIEFAIKLEERDDLGVEGVSIQLPCLDRKQAHFSLEVVPFLRNKELEEHGRYFLSTRSGMPFKINGVYSTGSFLMRGDQVDLGFYRFIFGTQAIVEANLNADEKISKSNLNIVFVGETGTGKTHLAQKYHEMSEKLGSFIHLNLSNLSPQLVESELFGHKKGAFTGAYCDKTGAIREAHRGTLFLDEIDSLSLEIQTKLLLFLEDKKVRPVGGQQSFECDVRLIFASGKKLEDCLMNKKMRQDFYYRMTSGIVIHLKPLRQQPELVKSICYASVNEKNAIISSRLIEQYQKLSWPGNIRQLKSHLNKKMILNSGRRLEWCHLDEELISMPQEDLNLEDVDTYLSLDEYKRRYCQRTFFRFGGSVKRSAEILGIAPNTLRSIVLPKAS